MNNLLNKAIQAIQDGKNDYAIGLLEGILEMNSLPNHNPLMNQPLKAYASIAQPISESSSDESSILDGMAAAKMNAIKQAANIEIA